MIPSISLAQSGYLYFPKYKYLRFNINEAVRKKEKSRLIMNKIMN
jgi:hypothetical protein